MTIILTGIGGARETASGGASETARGGGASTGPAPLPTAPVTTAAADDTGVVTLARDKLLMLLLE